MEGPATTTADNGMLTVAGAARMLGVHANTIRAWTDQGRLPCVRINRRGDRRYKAAELRRFLATAAAGESQSAAEQRPQMKALEEHWRRAEMLLNISNEISGQIDLGGTLGQLVDHAQRLFDADHAAILRRHPDGRFVFDVRRNLSDEFCAAIERVAHIQTPDDWDGRSVITITDDPTNPQLADQNAILRNEGIITLSAAPLFADDELVGGLCVLHDRPYRWRDDDREMFEQLARQGGIAIRNARNWSRTTKWAAQLQSIQELGARLTRLSTVREIGQSIAASLDQLIDYHNVRVYRVYGDEVVPVAWRGHVGPYVGEDGDSLRMKVGDGITGWVAEHGIAQILGDAAKDPRSRTIPGTEENLDESLLVAPLKFDDVVMGVIVLAKLGLNQFSPDDLRLLEIYASIAAQAMVNADAAEQMRAQSERLGQQVANQRELLRVTESILGTLDTQELLHEIAERLAALLFFDNIGVDVYDHAAGTLRPIFARGTNAAEYLSRTIRDSEGIGGYVVRSGEAELVQDEIGDGRVLHFAKVGPQAGALIAAPLRGRDGVTGLLTVERLGVEARFSDEEFDLVKLFAGHVSIALQNAEAHRAVEIRAQTDALTGLKNHGALTDHIRQAVGRGDSFALLMLDLDNFKAFNDQRGHEAGNVLLERIADVLRENVRESDEIFRYGGDEFAVVLPTTTLGGALAVARKIRNAVGKSGGLRRTPRVSCSVGVAVYPLDGTDAGSIVVAADRACYVAKRRGRDQIATAADGLSLAGEFLPPPTPVDISGEAYSAA
jgi:diguanylate cyclase (GGDEF)-like protein/excisionase family DNA binding protein